MLPTLTTFLVSALLDYCREGVRDAFEGWFSSKTEEGIRPLEGTLLVRYTTNYFTLEPFLRGSQLGDYSIDCQDGVYTVAIRADKPTRDRFLRLLEQYEMTVLMIKNY